MSFELSNFYLNHTNKIKYGSLIGAGLLTSFAGYKIRRNYLIQESYKNLLAKFPILKEFINNELHYRHLRHLGVDAEKVLAQYLYDKNITSSNTNDILIFEEEIFNMHDPISRFTIQISTNDQEFLIGPTFQLFAKNISFNSVARQLPIRSILF